MFRETKSIAVATDSCKRLIGTQDWFYSELYIKLMKAFYKSKDMEISDIILRRWREHEVQKPTLYRNNEEATETINQDSGDEANNANPQQMEDL